MQESGTATSTRTTTTTDRYLVVSSDTHIGPSVRHDLRPYCPAEHLDTLDEFLGELEHRDKSRSEIPVEYPDDYVRRRRELVELKAHDPEQRLAHMDEDGVAADVIYHGAQNGEPIPFSSTSLLTWSSPKYNDLEPVGVHMYNRWLADFCSVAPERHVGTAHVPIYDVAAAVEEVEWARAAGLGAVNLPATRRDFPTYEDPVWEPLWSACEANGMVLNTHAGSGDIHAYQGPGASAMFFMEFPFFARRSIWIMIFGGVFERHPGLKLVVTEQYGDWVPEVVRDMDSAYYGELSQGLRRVLPEPPSHYWASNCYVGASFMSHSEARLAVELGQEGQFMWGSDYPHIEGTWPRTTASLRQSFHDLEPDVVRRMVGGNAIDVYDFDRDALAPIAQRIGPTIEEVATPLDEVPSAIQGLSFRTIGKFS